MITCIGNLGRVGISKRELAFNQQINAIKPVKGILPKFTFYQAQNIYFKNQLEKFSTSTTVKLLNKNNFNLINFQIAPLPIQNAIVKKIEELFSNLDSGIQDLRQTQDKLKLYRQAVLQKAFKGELTNSKMIKKQLLSITSQIGDGLHGTPTYDTNGEYYFVNGNNLKDGKIIIKPDTKRVNKDEYLKNKKELNRNTVFVSINGTLGNTAFYNNEPIILGKSVCYINVNNEIDKKYLRYNFLSSEFLNYAIKNATGSTIKNVGLKTIRMYQVPLPKNASEQAQIVNEIEKRLSVCEQLEKTIEASLEQAKLLRQSILKKAFNGKLLSEAEIQICKKDKDYMPAPLILEKIKQEKNK